MRRWLFVLVIWLGAVSSAWPAETMPAKPARYFNDYAGVVSAQTANGLNTELENFEKQTSNQIVVAIFPKMESDSSLEDYTNRIAGSWKVGQSGKNNGAVLFIFIQEHKMRIEVGYGLEGALPDALAKRIIEDEITPHFKSGDYNGGVTAGVTAILQAVKGEYKGNGTTVNENQSIGDGMFFIWPIVFIVVFIFIFRNVISSVNKAGTVYGKNGRRIYTGGWIGGLGGWGGGGGGFGGGFGGGGGGFSGGGGGFGGGGASGGW